MKNLLGIETAIRPTIHDHNHRTTAIDSPQSPEHNHQRIDIIGEPQREKEVREERER